MSDVGYAPAASAPAPAAPAPATEAPVNVSPTSAPQPVGSQAPNRPETRRAAIEAAFKRAAEPPKPAQARIGHNQPPGEPLPVEREKPKAKEPPLDLKKRPVDQEKPPPPRARQERGEHGHFAPARSQAPGQPPMARQFVNPLPMEDRYREPPQRMGNHGKYEWHRTPASVRSEMHRMHHEFSQAYNRYRGDHEVMNSIRPFQKMAHDGGTTLARALANYTSMEHKLRSDPIAGLDVIVNNLNLRTSQGQRITLRDIAYYLLNQTAEQHQALQSSNVQNAQNLQIRQLSQQLQAVTQHQRRMQEQQQFVTARREVDRFAESHPRLDELGSEIERQLRAGYDLSTAYRRAELLWPPNAVHRIDSQQRRPVSRQQPVSDRSISGAPSSFANGAQRRRSDKPVSRRDALTRAFRHANGSL